MWVWLAAVVVILAIVKWTAIRSGPSANEAMVAIRVAQDELAQAQRIPRAAQSQTLNDAQAALNLAFSRLEEKRYEESILAAHKATASSRKLKG